MYSHYIKTAIRRIFNNKLYSLISILSLAIGMSAVILIAGFIRYENSFDRMHTGNEDIYRLNWGREEVNARFATFYNPVSPVLAEAFPAITDFTRLGIREHEIRIGDASHYLNVTQVDPGYFRLFDYPAVSGNAGQAISDLQSVVLTEAAATRLFGSTDVLGETMTVDGAFSFRVGAVVENNPDNSHLGGNVFINIENLPGLWGIADFWTRAGYFGSDVLYHYIRLAPGTDPVALKDAIESYFVSTLDPGYGEQVYLQALTDIHFTQDLQNEMPMVDDMLGTVKPLRQRTDILLFITIAVLSLSIAALNFMNMQAVQFTRQIREVGVRRVSGSSYPALVAQLLTESALMSFLALLLAIPICELMSPLFNNMLGMPTGLGTILTPGVIVLLVLAALCLGVLVGLYPAISASRIAPIMALRGELGQGRTANHIRAFLIVLQFTISIGLIIGSFTVRNQIDYAMTKSLGFNPDNVVQIELPTEEASNAYSLLRSELLNLAGVESVSAGSTIPTRSLSDGTGYIPEGGAIDDDLILTRSVVVSEGYFETLGMPMVAGRSFSTAFPGDLKPPLSADNTTANGGLILNEAAARVAGWENPEEAIGKRLITGFQVGDAFWLNNYTIVGVVADAHFSSIRREVEPVSYQFPQVFTPGVLVAKLNGDNTAGVLAGIDRIWREIIPELPIQRSLLSEDYSALYSGETRTFTLFIALSSLAILIACSGLYGLATYVTERRTKEIGIRKVMGSGVMRIVLLISNDFSRLVLLSNVIAWPMAWYFMQRWLENFAYRIDLTPLVFVGSGLIAFCIAWVTVGSKAAKAASRSPVLALRYE